MVRHNSSAAGTRRRKATETSVLPERLERRLLLYALATGGAIGLAAGPGQARVVFTPSNATFFGDRNFPIDLNNDGTTDLVLELRLHYGFDALVYLTAVGEGGNGILHAYSQFAAAVHPGGLIGAGASTFSNQGVMASDYVILQGQFVAARRRFLGVKFLIQGQTHYGWVGFRSVTFHGSHGFAVNLAGWAYETEPNTAIIAGVRPSGGEAEWSSGSPRPAAQPTSLELLARGNVALADWRRRKAAAA
jgi:hypothetical protein